MVHVLPPIVVLVAAMLAHMTLSRLVALPRRSGSAIATCPAV
jgi:hypothetical protein